MLKTGVLVTLLCSAFTGPASATAGCGREKDHVDYRECLERKASQSRVELEQALALLGKRIDSWDEEFVYRRRAHAHLQQSFELFQRFRESHCQFEASLAAGGNAAGDMRLHCEAELNNQYATSLRSRMTHVAAPG
ncbi:lysozyme inhibitor LprI family protein [Massilia sp. BSC265]|uniref:lysozyme inhibitor LprI family protein n=1 Tax=Massilia sp. BSC265 TaxID=1549812 RepID=UPI0009E0516D|nr:lysozyme inhibitor LprI family protein [Massilia sp. BSC265]